MENPAGVVGKVRSPAAPTGPRPCAQHPMLASSINTQAALVRLFLLLFSLLAVLPPSSSEGMGDKLMTRFPAQQAMLACVWSGLWSFSAWLHPKATMPLAGAGWGGGRSCFQQCFSTPSLAKASSLKALLHCHSSTVCPSSACTPNPKLSSPLKTFQEQFCCRAEPPAPGEGQRKPQEPLGWGWSPPTPGPLGRRSNSSQPFSANHSCDHTRRAGHSG